MKDKGFLLKDKRFLIAFVLVVVAVFVVVFLLQKATRVGLCTEKYQVFEKCVPVDVANAFIDANQTETFALNVQQRDRLFDFFKSKGLVFERDEARVFTKKAMETELLVDLADVLVASDIFDAINKNNIAILAQAPEGDSVQLFIGTIGSVSENSNKTSTILNGKLLVGRDKFKCISRCNNEDVQPPDVTARPV